MLSQISFLPIKSVVFHKASFLSFLHRDRKKSVFLRSPVGVKNNSLVNVSSQSAKGSSKEGMATAASSQSLPKAMLEGATG